MEHDGELQLSEILHLTSLKEVFGGFAHEIAQPLNALMIAAQVIQFKVEQSILLEDEKNYVLQRLDLMMKQVKRASEIVDGLRSFNRGTWSETCAGDLVKILHKVQNMMGQQFLGRGIEFCQEAPESLALHSVDAHVVGAAIIQTLAYSRDHVEAIAAWHEKRTIPYRKRIALKCMGTDGGPRVEFSWDLGAMPAAEIRKDLAARKGFLIAHAILTALGGTVNSTGSCIHMTFGK